MQFPQSAARLEPELGGEKPSRLLIDLQRLSGPATPVQGKHEVLVESPHPNLHRHASHNGHYDYH